MSALTIHHHHSSPIGDVPSPSEAWRWQARRVLAELRDLLLGDPPPAYDGWLAARGAGVLRERRTLLSRLSVLASRTLREPAAEQLRAELVRLQIDVDHHLQRRRDLAWDEVELELGGSE